MKLVDVYQEPIPYKFLYRLIIERPKEANINNKTNPTYGEHIDFVDKKPYRDWFIIKDKKKSVGAICVTKSDEIGVFILIGEKRKGYGAWAVKEVISRHPCVKVHANINPRNKVSIKFFSNLGFKHIANVYEYAE